MYDYTVMILTCKIINKLDNKIVKKIINSLIINLRHPRILFNYEGRGGCTIIINKNNDKLIGVQIMRSNLLITGFLSGWWCVLALVQPLPPLKTNKLMINNLNSLINELTNNNDNLINYDNRLRFKRTLRRKGDSVREKRKNCKKLNNNNCRGKNWCPDMDISNRAFLSPTVFEGKARSMSSSRKPGSNYAVTFEVKQVYKSQSGFQPLKKNDSVRLHFRDKLFNKNNNSNFNNKSTLCHNNDVNDFGSYNNDVISYEKNRMINYYKQKIIRADIKRGKVYIVFVNRVGPRNFTILGEPVIRSKKNEAAVQAVVRPDYVREVTLSELRDSVARARDRVKLVCRTRGSPPPRVHWLKDGVPLNPRRGLKIQHKRRRSKIVITSARPEDSGRYECIAQSSSGYRASLAAQLLVVHDAKIPDTTTVAWPRQEQPCPIAGDFCMNGGTCLFFETVGEPACSSGARLVIDTHINSSPTDGAYLLEFPKHATFHSSRNRFLVSKSKQWMLWQQCLDQDQKTSKQPFLWVLSKKTELKESELKQITKELLKWKIRSSMLEKTDNTDCPHYYDVIGDLGENLASLEK